MTYADELATTLELAQWATRRMTARPTSVTTKANAADLVTETDREIERHVRAVLADRFPDHVGGAGSLRGRGPVPRRGVQRRTRRSRPLQRCAHPVQ